MDKKNAAKYVIENENLKVTVSSLGAELINLYDKKKPRELLWQGNEAVWPGQAPVLFPLIGRLKGKTFEYEGKKYEIDIHGFAKIMEFSLNNKTNNSVSLTLASNDATRKQYPFDFEFTVRYTLNNRTLLKEHIVKNTSGKVMYYEVGGHEGYNLPLTGSEKMSDYWLLFKGKEALYSFTKNEQIMMLNKKRKVDLSDGRLYLKMSVFSDDALVLEDDAGKIVELHGKQTGHILTVKFPDFKYLGIWTKNLPFDTNYVCIEPWSSLPDFADLGIELTEKIGIRKLAAGKSETLGFTIEVV